ncbi:MAG TPA: tRNA (N(6)-L-threonylcarbamoyladenosine(37)-C(2))-methylthiotransferase MtaB [Anaerolineae bacterium]|nr:tRNA (N(6)-L-threonylcarbamoyladenosine(37)-C(2))-methylthiotransferase MtaB [Anaerolineae bacterium]
MRIRLDSIGCRLNISEVEELARRFAAAGHRLVGPGDLADLYVFNTCAVTQAAERKSRQIIRQMRRANPKAAVVVTGCYAQLSAQQLRDLGADLVVSNEDKERLPELATAAGLIHDGDPIPALDDPAYLPGFGSAGLEAGHTRAFIKVQDGCDNRCTFCIVTIARGAGRSRALADVVTEVKRLVDLGYQEAVLSGVHLGSYGHDLGEAQGLQTLVRAILTETDLPRLRLSSLEPWDLEAGFFKLWQDKRLLPHLHLPLQSGCDATLRRMARRTSQAEFSRLVEVARATIPDLAITTDVIVGFPGETEAEFAASIAFVERMAFAKLHIFRYSRRAGTTAAKMRGQVPGQVQTERSRQMHELNSRLEDDFRRRFVGRTMPVLWESSEPYGFGRQWSGLTGNYLRVVTQTPTGLDLRNLVIETDLIDTAPASLLGRLPESFQPAGLTLPLLEVGAEKAEAFRYNNGTA